MKFNSIKFKISVLYTGILGLILVVYSAILYFSLSYSLYKDQDQELTFKAYEIKKIINAYLDKLGAEPSSFVFAMQRAILLPAQHPYQDTIKELESAWAKEVNKLDINNLYINFLDHQKISVACSPNIHPKLLPLFIKIADRFDQRHIIFENIHFKKRHFRVITLPYSYGQKEEYLIQVGTSLTPIITILRNKSLYIAFSILLLLLLTAFLGKFFVSKIINPALAIAKAATTITHEDLSARVKAEDVEEEMEYLVNSFNAMISRLEQSFNHIREFSGNVAHELKTPLAIIRGECEVALRKERDNDYYKRVITVSLEEILRMLRTIEDLLLLTKLEYRQDIYQFEQLDLIKFMKEIYEQTKLLAAQKKLTVTFHPAQAPLYIKGDIVRLRRLFFNIINNAIKFTTPSGTLDIQIQKKDSRAVIAIADSGVGIAPQDLPHIFKRFFHKDKSEQDNEPGNGLGLSIALSIAQMHQGSIEVESTLGQGSTFKIMLPLV